MQQSNAAATALYNHPGGGTLQNAGPASDAGDAVMARWLQSAGLQHLASPLTSTGIDHRLLPNLLMQVLFGCPYVPQFLCFSILSDIYNSFLVDVRPPFLVSFLGYTISLFIFLDFLLWRFSKVGMN